MSHVLSNRLLTPSDVRKFRMMEARTLPEARPRRLLWAALAVLLLVFGACTALPQSVQATTSYVHKVVSSAVAPLATTNFVNQAIAAIPALEPESDPVALPVARAALAAGTNAQELVAAESQARAAGDANALATAASLYQPKGTYLTSAGGSVTGGASIVFGPYFGSTGVLAGTGLYFYNSENNSTAIYGPSGYLIADPVSGTQMQFSQTQTDVLFAGTENETTFHWPDESAASRTIATREHVAGLYQPIGAYLEAESDPVALPVAQAAFTTGTNAQQIAQAAGVAITNEAALRAAGDSNTLAGAAANAATKYVPYYGATGDVDLGEHKITSQYGHIDWLEVGGEILTSTGSSAIYPDLGFLYYDTHGYTDVSIAWLVGKLNYSDEFGANIPSIEYHSGTLCGLDGMGGSVTAAVWRDGHLRKGGIGGPEYATQDDLDGYVSTNSFGCGTLSGTTPTITGMPFAYSFTPTNSYTLSISPTAPRGHYSVEVYGTNACTFGAGIVKWGDWTPSATNIVAFKPSGATNYIAVGRAF